MIINHNMTAAGAYRQLSINSGNQAKSTEKLSSGLRINRAGDDAAGLAISEKMRGQIRGLDQAARNSQDGISMIQTAEGALNETHSILQRMRELANQSANDTNVGVDREEIQKEMNQLSSEINRIGNTTEFNTQKLLNGGGVEKNLTAKTLATGAAKGVMGPATALTTAGGTAAKWDTQITGVLGAAGDSGTFEFNGMKVILKRGADHGSAVTAQSPVVNAAAKTVELTYQDNGGTVDADATAGYIKAALDAYKADSNTFELKDFTVSLTGTDTVTLTASGPASGALDIHNNENVTVSGIAGTTTETAGVNAVAAGSTAAQVTVVKNSTAAVAAEWAGKVTAITAGQTSTVSFNGVTIDLKSSPSGAVAASATSGRNASVTVADGADAETTAKALKSAFEAAQSFGGSELKDFTFSVRGAGTAAEFVITDKASNGDYNNALKLETSGGATKFNGANSINRTTAGVDEARGEYRYEIEKAFEKVGTTVTIGGKTFTAVEKDANTSLGQFNVGTDANKQAIGLAAAINADADLSKRFDAIVDGGKIKLVEKEGKAAGSDLTNGIVANNTAAAAKFAINLDSSIAVGGKYTVDGVDIKVVDDVSDPGLANGTAVMYDATLNGQASKLRDAIASNTTLNQKYNVAASGSMITLEQKTNQESMTSVEGSTNTTAKGKFDASFQIGANTGQSMTIEIDDMRSQALKVTGDSSASTVTAKNGKTASYVEVANVSNGTDNKSVEFALDVSTHEKASAAVSVINDAIEKVSAQRSQLGAFQNRLEHTINNLNTSSENLTAAESRIRDTDMAKTVMENTKNGILAQAAQAMLAQANQAPQQVLQLLR